MALALTHANDPSNPSDPHYLSSVRHYRYYLGSSVGRFNSIDLNFYQLKLLLTRINAAAQGYTKPQRHITFRCPAGATT